jgi:hypothetical protein
VTGSFRLFLTREPATLFITLFGVSPVINSIVGIVTGYGLDGGGVGVRVPVGSRIFAVSIQALGPTQPSIEWVPGALSPGVKRRGREADHSPPTSAEVKKIWIYTPTPICLHGVVLN